MSIVCNYYYAITENGKRRLILGAELRRMLLARYQAQRHLYRFQQQIKKVRDYSSETLEHERSASQGRSALSGLRAQLASLQKELEYAKNGVVSQMNRIKDAREEIGEDQKALDTAIEDASCMLGNLDKLKNTQIDDIDRLAELFHQDSALIENVENLEREIVRLETELRFIGQKQEFQPVAAAALSAMADNGYELRETVSEEGLLAYFEQSETGRRIAVRIEPPVQENKATEKWEILAETFQMSGEQCLMEMEDFETSLEDFGNRLDFGDIRIYPKEDHSVEREKRGLLPDFSSILKRKRTADAPAIKNRSAEYD